MLASRVRVWQRWQGGRSMAQSHGLAGIECERGMSTPCWITTHCRTRLLTADCVPMEMDLLVNIDHQDPFYYF